MEAFPVLRSCEREHQALELQFETIVELGEELETSE